MVLPSVQGGSVDFSQQFIAGNTLLLWFVDPLDLPAAVDMLTDRAKIFLELETKPFIILTSPSEEVTDECCGSQSVVMDPAAKFSAGLGVESSGIVIIDPNNRFNTLLLTVKIDEAVEVCRGIHDSTQDQEVLAQAPVLLVPSVLDPSLCTDLIDYWGDGEKLIDAVASNTQGHQKSRPDLKKRHDVALLDKALYGRVKQDLTRRLIPEIFKVFGFKTSNMEAVRIGCYDSAYKGFFGRHRDNRTRYTAHRKFAVTLNLSQNYDGGQVRFPEYGRLLYSSKTGGAIVFSCSLLHEALPVTKGKRFAMFTFLTDSEGEAMAKKMRIQEGDAVKGYRMQD